ncbi:MAG TPA: hypothetical protein VFG53_10660 [Anaeromyxobacter sp.]|nr:hypothetical protein [Anaeromyxobacter sp.]
MSDRTRMILATLSETRPDYRPQREPLALEERAALGWLREAVELTESEVLTSPSQIRGFVESLDHDQHVLVVHIPVWTEPLLTVRLAELLPLPLVLLGNTRPETSSIVGMLGAGGALDQIGRRHLRIFDPGLEESRRDLFALGAAARALRTIRGQTLGLFGGRSLGMITATADPAQWHQLFGVDIDQTEQSEIVALSERVPEEEVARHFHWLTSRLEGVRFGGAFTREGLLRQIRGYLAIRLLARKKGYAFIGVKCQPELSDGYASHCVAHMLCNGTFDGDGPKHLLVHACEADADGALTMQILHLLSGGKAAALLDVRWLDVENGVWTLANCGAMPAAFASEAGDEAGLSRVQMVPHIFGTGGGGALPFVATPRPVTLARLCRKDGRYWMAALRGEVEERGAKELASTTSAFPQAFVRTGVGLDFLQSFGSNHIHMVTGDYLREVRAFCRIAGVDCRVFE